MKEFSPTSRTELIIYLYTLKKLNQLKRYGYIHYASKRMKYVIMYVDSADLDQTIDLLHRLHFVRSVEVSSRKEIETRDFSTILSEVVNVGKVVEDSKEQDDEACE